MKMQNPFNRLKKKEFVPLSLFPCSKVTKTSMDIGRATPVYTCEMIQGNKISIDAAQLTRFASLDVPTMNEFEVGLGAYFVPYVSFDEYFNNHTINKFAKNNSDFANSMNHCALHARDFFNPALDDSLRVHPLTLTGKFLSGVDLVGSLFDHLGYYIGDHEKFNEQTVSYRYSGTDATLDGQTAYDILLSANATSEYIRYRTQIVFSDLYDSITEDSVPLLPIDIFVMNKYIDGRLTPDFNLADIEDVYTEGYYNRYLIPISVIYRDLLGDTSISITDSWESVFGNVTQSQVLRSYITYLTSTIKMLGAKEFGLNVVRALAYYRIYADWFLDDTLVHKDDFLALVGGAYTYAYLGYPNLDSCFYLSQRSLPSDSKARMFVNELRYGRCLPVPAEKNYFTACKPTQTNNTFSDFNFIGNGVAETPIGSTIHENFFNRAYQRFKDFVTRLGYDYRRNTAGIYGHDSNDDSLISSQLFGSATFDVKIGDIAQTSESTSSSQQGNLSGIAMSRGGSSKWTFTANENGLVMILAWIRPKSTSIVGTIDRSMFKSNYNDYLNPMFGGVCMQDVMMDEIYPKGSNTSEKFGETEIYSEYMSVNSECSGLMRTSLKSWNADRFLENKPAPLTSSDGLKLMYYNNDWYDDLNRNFMDKNTSPILTTLYFTGNVTRQLPEAIRTDF